MVRRYLFTLLLVCAAAVAAHAGITGNLTGRVVDKAKKPVAGATIRVMGTTKGANAKVDGKYNIVGITAGTITVRVTAVGYDTLTETVNLSADQTREINFTLLEGGGKTTETVVVTADKEIVRSTDLGSEQTIGAGTLTSIARNNVADALSLSAGIVARGNNFQVRGGRTDETQVQVDGLTVTDQFTGGLGNSGGSTSSSMPSPYALQQVQAKTGGFGAEFGNATAGIVNSVVKTGSTDKFSGLVNWRKDVPFLFGKSSSGVLAGAPLEDVVDVTLDGPIGINQSTFSIAVRNTFQNHRNFGLQVLDPIGNNLGMMPNNRTWSRNMLGRLRFEIVNGVSLLVGGMYGTSSFERSGWGWLYANDQGMKVDDHGNPILNSNGQRQLNGVPERIAKQAAIQDFSSNAFAQINHTLGATTIYDLRFSYNGKTTELGKRQTADAPSIFNGFDLWYPQDVETADSVYHSGPNRILDVYDAVRTSAFTEDGFVKIEVTKPNPLTGYVEGAQDLTSTANPYGLINYFVARGNEFGVDYRNSRFFQFDGNLSHGIEVGDTRHNIKTGFELRLMRLTRHYNGNPWVADPAYDVFGSDYGGNLYFDVSDPAQLAAKEASEQPYSPVTGAFYAQDQISFKGLVFTPGLRVDYLDAAAQFRTQYDPFVRFGSDSGFAKTSAKVYLSPRISVTYPVSETGRQNINLSYGIYYQAPPFASFYDFFNAYSLRGTGQIGNPAVEMQRTNQYQVGYNHQLNDDLAFSITGYYRDIYNQSSLSYIAVLPVPYFQRVLSDYGSARGIEFTFQKRTIDNWGLNLNYSLASSKGTANDDNSAPAIDPVTERPAYPVTDFPLSFDRRHRINGILTLQWGNDEGPSIAGISFLEYVSINISGYWQSGLPYTPSNGAGQAIGNFNSARYPSNWSTELRVLRTIPLGNLIGGDAALDIYFDATNLLNFTDAVLFYPRTGDADYDGSALNRVPGDFPSTTYFRDIDPTNKATVSPSQYDRIGNRQYNARVDFDQDGKVTPQESYRGYQDYVQTVVSQNRNYQYPRTVYFGATFRF